CQREGERNDGDPGREARASGETGGSHPEGEALPRAAKAGRQVSDAVACSGRNRTTSASKTRRTCRWKSGRERERMEGRRGKPTSFCDCGGPHDGEESRLASPRDHRYCLAGLCVVRLFTVQARYSDSSGGTKRDTSRNQ